MGKGGQKAKRLLIRWGRTFDHFLGIIAVLGMVIMTATMLAVCWEVVSRYFLSRATIWVIEFSEYALLYMTFLGTAWLLKQDGHVEMDLLAIWLSEKTRRLMRGIVSLFGALLCLVLGWFGAVVSLDHLRRGLHQPTLIGPPDFPLLAVIPLGFFLLFIQFLRRAYGCLEDQKGVGAKERLLSKRS